MIEVDKDVDGHGAGVSESIRVRGRTRTTFPLAPGAPSMPTAPWGRRNCEARANTHTGTGSEMLQGAGGKVGAQKATRRQQ